MASPRQTISFLRAYFREAGIRPDTRHGQNFLIDLNLVDLLAASADLSPRDVVLEVGTGTGTLTTRLARHAAAVVTVEIDSQMAQLAREQLADYDNVTLIQQDVLRNKNNLHVNVLDTIRQKLDEADGGRFKLVANLPYNIATPVISNLLALEMVPELMAVTIQKELADRILAAPSTKDYGALSVWVQSQANPELVRVMPPSVFWPRPKVHSAIIRIEINREKRQQIPDLDFFHRFVRSLFFHRRKFLRSVLISAFKRELQKADVDEVLGRTQLSGELRAEQLDVDTILRLCECFRRYLQESSRREDSP